MCVCVRACVCHYKCASEYAKCVSEYTECPVQPPEEMYLCSRSCITLQLFFKDSQGDEDETCLEYLSFHGTPLDVTNMKDFKRVRLHGNITLHLS